MLLTTCQALYSNEIASWYNKTLSHCFLFVAVINDLIEQGRLSGTIQGRQDKANFVPDIYSRTQNAWVDAFYQQNGYLGRYLCLIVLQLII